MSACTHTSTHVLQAFGDVAALSDQSQLKSLYGVNGQLVGLFREGRDTPDISCPVEVGAATTVQESRFAKYVDLSKVFPRAAAAGTGSDIFPEKPQPEAAGVLP
jgi:hypothetical protein